MCSTKADRNLPLTKYTIVYIQFRTSFRLQHRQNKFYAFYIFNNGMVNVKGVKCWGFLISGVYTASTCSF